MGEITLVETNSMVYGLIKAVLRLKSNRLAFQGSVSVWNRAFWRFIKDEKI